MADVSKRGATSGYGESNAARYAKATAQIHAFSRELKALVAGRLGVPANLLQGDVPKAPQPPWLDDRVYGEQKTVAVGDASVLAANPAVRPIPLPLPLAPTPKTEPMSLVDFVPKRIRIATKAIVAERRPHEQPAETIQRIALAAGLQHPIKHRIDLGGQAVVVTGLVPRNQADNWRPQIETLDEAPDDSSFVISGNELLAQGLRANSAQELAYVGARAADLGIEPQRVARMPDGGLRVAGPRRKVPEAERTPPEPKEIAPPTADESGRFNLVGRRRRV